MRSHRPLLMGRNGAVGANHPMATQAGLDTLRAGGNAADAAVAVALALGVVEPMMSGLGGDGFYHLWIGGHAEVVNATGPAPRSAAPETFPRGIEVEGPRAVSVPGMLGGLGRLHASHGRLPWARVCAPAVALAREGYGVTVHASRFAGDNLGKLGADPRSAAVFLPGGAAPKPGAWITQENLARTLEMIAADGAETFYRGRLAQALASGFAECRVAITAADLAAYEPEVQAPIAIPYRGFEVRQTPPNSTGFTLLQILRIAERFDLAAMDAAQRIHLLVEAKKLAFLDRERFGADPRFGAIPLERLLSDAHAEALAARISRDRATNIPQTAVSADTTYFCVVDAEGNAVSGIQSLNSLFGSGVTAGETGVLLNNRMAYWHLAPGHANRLAPGKRVRHTMNAPMIFRNGKLWAVLGTPGADNQVQVNAQVLTSLIDLGLDPQEAVERPRWTSSQPHQGANWPHAGDDKLTIERDVGEAALAALAARGHDLLPVAHLEGPCAMQVIRVLDNGVRQAASDPRRDGWAGAF